MCLSDLIIENMISIFLDRKLSSAVDSTEASLPGTTFRVLTVPSTTSTVIYDKQTARNLGTTPRQREHLD